MKDHDETIPDQRAMCLARLPGLSRPDVVIIGGGVNGIATLRDLALNGVSAVLLEKGDFCAGASSASSRMAHGGLRYLEGREFRLVSESARERNLLLTCAGHLVQPLEIMVPLPGYVTGFAGSVARFLGLSRRAGPLSLAALKGALCLYEFFGRVNRTLPTHSTYLTRRSFPRGLRRQVKALVSYYDGQITQPEGLALEMLGDALAVGPTVAALNHVTLRHVNGQFEVICPDTGAHHMMTPRVVINATGAWIDHVNRDLGCATRYLRQVKGAHLALHHPELFQRMDGRAFYFDDGTGRMIIALPIGENVLVGTTEVETGNPEDHAVSDDEVGYLLRAMDGLFTDIAVTAKDIVTVTSGIRPLRRSDDSQSATSAARDHALEEDWLPGQRVAVLSLVGGKWTTFRAFAEAASDRTLELLGRDRVRDTARLEYPGRAPCTAEDIMAAGASERPRAEMLLRRYGALGCDVARFCARDAGDRPLNGAPQYSSGEIAWLIRHRAARTLEDVLLRRTQLTLGHGLRDETLQDVAGILVRTLGCDTASIAAQITQARRDPRLVGFRNLVRRT